MYLHGARFICRAKKGNIGIDLSCLDCGPFKYLFIERAKKRSAYGRLGLAIVESWTFTNGFRRFDATCHSIENRVAPIFILPLPVLYYSLLTLSMNARRSMGHALG